LKAESGTETGTGAPLGGANGYDAGYALAEIIFS
jgi:hypothetical protein